MFGFVSSLSGENFQTTSILPTTASETYTEGEALVLSSGTLTKCGATTAPTFIAAKAYVAPSSGQLDLPVYPILPNHVYKTTFAADGSSSLIGTKLTLHTDGAQITATTSSGVATLVKKLGTGASGTEALVRFI